MNDDFLYRLRTEPPAPFAAQLKERLDRGSKRKARTLRFGLGVLLFGTAFAMVSPTVRHSVAEVIDWIRGAPPPIAAAPADANPGLARAFGDRKAESPTAPAENANAPSAADEEVREGARAMLDAARPRGPLPSGLPAAVPAPNDSADASPSDANSTDIDAQLGGARTEGSQSGFIVTGPLLGEVGTAAYRFETRRAYFTVMAYSMQPLEDMVKARAPINRQIAARGVYRVGSLTMMMPDVFATDDRNSNVPTRSKPAVWANRRDFMLQSYEFVKTVKALVDEVKIADDARVRELIGQIDAGCTSCHEKFRQGGDENVGSVYP